jgi:hypothetical protein
MKTQKTATSSASALLLMSQKAKQKDKRNFHPCDPNHGNLSPEQQTELINKYSELKTKLLSKSFSKTLEAAANQTFTQEEIHSAGFSTSYNQHKKDNTQYNQAMIEFPYLAKKLQEDKEIEHKLGPGFRFFALKKEIDWDDNDNPNNDRTEHSFILTIDWSTKPEVREDNNLKGKKKRLDF